jgi:hypothetical protein
VTIVADDVPTPTKTAGGLAGFLTKKIGPMPAGVWLIVLLIAGFVVYRTRSGIASGVNVSGTADGGSGTVPATGSGSYTPVGSGPGGNNPGSGVPSGTPTFGSNQAWGTAAINYLTGLGYEGVSINQAIQSFLASYNLTSQQQTWVNLAIIRLGAPPEVVPPSTENPPPVGSPTGPPPVKDLTVSSAGSDFVNLEWSPSPGALKYRIVASSSHGSWSPVETTSTFWKSSQVNKLGQNLDHTFTVWAIGESGASAPRTVTAHTAPDPFKFPAGL